MEQTPYEQENTDGQNRESDGEPGDAADVNVAGLVRDVDVPDV
jgi:hypothetical protein